MLQNYIFFEKNPNFLRVIMKFYVFFMLYILKIIILMFPFIFLNTRKITAKVEYMTVFSEFRR